MITDVAVKSFIRLFTGYTARDSSFLPFQTQGLFKEGIHIHGVEKTNSY